MDAVDLVNSFALLLHSTVFSEMIATVFVRFQILILARSKREILRFRSRLRIF